MMATDAWDLLRGVGVVVLFPLTIVLWRATVSSAGRSLLVAVLFMLSLGLLWFWFVGMSAWDQELGPH
jgi:phosphoglycerol transferase MdoB-like AlkP superfamily enzyme